jgi:hypothetical protein
MIRVLSDGHDGHRIENADGIAIGTIRNGTIRLGGFASERAALDAVVPLWTALDGSLARQYPGWRRHEPTQRLRLAHDGAHEWVSDGSRPLARIGRPAARAAGRELSLEFVLPSFATDGALITAATALVRALEEHRAAFSRAPLATIAGDGATDVAVC